MAKPLSNLLPPRKRILLVDDHAVVRQGIAELINEQPDLEVCGEAESELEVLPRIAETNPDLLLLDITLGDASGIEVISQVKARFPALPILVLTMHAEAVYAELAISAGASGYITKAQAISNVLTAARRVLAGEVYLSDAAASLLIRKQVARTAGIEVEPVRKLSTREMQVFQLIGRWKGTRQIADELKLSVKTVEYYQKQIKDKLHLKNASELIRYAIEWKQDKQAPRSSVSLH